LEIEQELVVYQQKVISS